MGMRKERTEAYAFSDRCVRPGSGGMGRTTVLGNLFLNGRSDPACGWNSHESRVLSEETRPPVSVRMDGRCPFGSAEGEGPPGAG